MENESKEIMTSKLTKIGVALLFAVTFSVAGVVIPIMYASHAPDDRFIDVHDFEAQDAHPDDDAHYLCFDREVKRGATGTVDINLHRVEGPSGFSGYVDGGVSDADASHRYFQEGHHKIIRPVPLPNDLREGEYRYVLVIRLELANGDVMRQFTYHSNTFNVTESAHNGTARRGFDCGELATTTRTQVVDDNESV